MDALNRERRSKDGVDTLCRILEADRVRRQTHLEQAQAMFSSFEHAILMLLA